MNWFDEALGSRQHEQRVSSSTQPHSSTGATTLQARQREEVLAFDALMQRLLREYADSVYGKSLFQKRFLLRLERPGSNTRRSWDWHWHLYSLVSGKSGLEVRPSFSAAGIIHGFTFISEHKQIEVSPPDEAAVKDGLVSLYFQ